MNDFDDVADGDFAVLIHIGLFTNEGRRLSLKQIINDAHNVRYADRAITIGIAHQRTDEEGISSG